MLLYHLFLILARDLFPFGFHTKTLFTIHFHSCVLHNMELLVVLLLLSYSCTLQLMFFRKCEASYDRIKTNLSWTFSAHKHR